MKINKFNLRIPNETNFIGSWDIDHVLCEKLIDYFKSNHADHHDGLTADGVDKSKKKSIDLTIYPKNLSQNDNTCINVYLQNLLECYKSYKETWPFLNSCFEKLDIGPFNIQKYDPGGHFAKIHSERTSLEHLHRLFAFMTYLNDDFDGGKTIFTHFDLDIKPVTGRTMIWPAEWTHAHKGDVVTKGSKYIITGWLNIPLLP